MAAGTRAERRITRCAIYTRKSTESGLDMAVNSLETQREVCQAYIKCQAHRNWSEVSHRYDDGGYSGGTLERPALRQLIEDVEAGRVDMIVIYKIDRLTRSLLDFVRLVDVLEKYGASFVSVTQSFDTSDSMGRLVLNVLLTFAQFERELMSDRVRDKKAAMRRKGLFTGGMPPFGYLIEKGGRLVVDFDRAPLVRELFRRYPTTSTPALVNDLRNRGCVTRRWVSKTGRPHGGQPITTAIVRQILTNPIYTGNIVHRGEWIKAQIAPLITRAEWDRVQEIRLKRTTLRNPDRDFLVGILRDERGQPMRIRVNGPGRTNPTRYYRTEHRGWRAGRGMQRILVNADRVERLAVSAVTAMLFDKVQLKRAVLSRGLYSDEIASLLKKGRLAAQRVADMDSAHIRRLFLALIPRAEVSPTRLTLYVSCYELTQFLAWNGVGLFTKSALKPLHLGDRVHVIEAPAALICGRRTLAVPVHPCRFPSAAPKPWLVQLLKEAAALREFMLEHREKSIAELAKEKRMGPNHFARLLRINYLAPDIQTAIYDGTQPAKMSQHDILYGPMPLDWDHQRHVLGFA
jgi:site-specific DNA recombinase